MHKGAPCATGVDGEFGAGTKTAVRAFERFQQRNVDGVVTRLDVLVLRDVVTNGSAVAKASQTGGALPKNAAAPKIAPTAPPAPAPLKLGPGMTATVGADGLAVAPAQVPPIEQQVIAAGNAIATMPYRYGGGHGSGTDTGYDCSGSVSYQRPRRSRHALAGRHAPTSGYAVRHPPGL